VAGRKGGAKKMRLRHRTVGRLAAVFLMAGIGLTGCMTRDPLKAQRAERWRPNVSARERDISDHPGAEQLSSRPPSVLFSNGVARANGNGVERPGARLLKHGDRVVIDLQGIPSPQSIPEEVDSNGDINLPHIGTVHVEGMTTFEVEKLIEEAYISGGIYTAITVIVTTQADEYYIRGEVKGPGKKPLTGDTTLLMAISTAGGYTDFANKKKIEILRGKEVKTSDLFNAVLIKDGRAEDPLIEPGDIIIVHRAKFRL